MAVNHYRQVTVPQRRHGSQDVQAGEEGRARDVLTRYRDYVATTIQPQLERLKEEAAEAAYDAEMAREEVTSIAKRLKEAVMLVADLRQASIKDRAEADERIRRLAEHHELQLSALQRAHQSEVRTLKDDLERVTQRYSEAQRHQYAESSTQSLLDKANIEISLLRSQDVALKSRVDDLAATVEDLERERAALAPFAASNKNCQFDLQSLVREASEFTTGITTALNHIDCGSVEVSNVAAQWRQVLVAFADPSHGDFLAPLVSEVRRLVKVEHAAIAGVLKVFVVRHTQALEAAASTDHERRQEKDLAKRRLVELEDDLRTERETMLVALERERIVQRLSSPTGPAVVTMPALAPTAKTSTAAAWCQTGTELLGARGEQQQAARLLEEVFALQQQVAHHRETIQHLEHQRRVFMDFVDDDAISAQVHAALTGGMSTENFMTRSLPL
jgi:hypothetical protein